MKGKELKMSTKKKRRLDKDRITLKKGESQRKDGRYSYRWTADDGTRHTVYALTLDELREKERQIAKDLNDGIRAETKNTTLNDLFDLWCTLKRGLKDNTFQNYKYMYTRFVRDGIGKQRVSAIKKSDIRRFYNTLIDGDYLRITTLETVHGVLHQVFRLAVEDGYVRQNPTDNLMREIKQAYDIDRPKRKSLTVAEQALFVDFLKRSPQYRHWYPVFAVMLGTGMRVGEVTGLRWCDIDLEKGSIDINHTLVYYNRGNGNGCEFGINTPKTRNSKREIPMMDIVKEAFLEEQEFQRENGISCRVSIEGYTDFIFVNRFGDAQHQGTLNKALRRIIRDCNDQVFDSHSGKGERVLLPHFSCHHLRHTFTTRLIEAGTNVKVVQEILGHADISTTLDIYADVTEDTKVKTFRDLENTFKSIGICGTPI